MERESSSEEEDDRETLIEQNDTKHLQNQNQNHNQRFPTSSPRRSSFHIDGLGSLGTVRRRFSTSHINKRWFLFTIVLLPFFIALVFFSADIRNLFSFNLKLDSNSLSDHMRESELHALYLLRQQQLSLLSLWNRSFANSISNSNSTLNSQDFQSALLTQISFNKQIQQLLLSPHKFRNANASSDVSFVDLDSGRCPKVDQKFSQRKTIEWKPRSNKFLLAICLSGQMSNHLICLEKHMFFAALLNRVLVIPSSKFDYQYSRVLDIQHINDCLGTKAVVTFEEFMQIKKNHPHLDRFICYFSSPTPCFVDEEHVKKLKGLGISMGKLESPWEEDVKRPSKRTVQDVQAKFASEDDVIVIGDVFYADIELEWVMQPGGPIAHSCKTLIEPSKHIRLTAQRFVQTFLGKDFVALHFRRHGFLKFCNAKQPSCFYPIPQAADCITRVVKRAKAPAIYLSTDAAESETDLLKSLVVLDGKRIPLVKRPHRNSAEKWDALLYRHGLEEDPQVEAMLDKTISAMSSVFIGASGSTFTEDILRLRKGWESASLCDEYLCNAEVPNFIAEDE